MYLLYEHIYLMELARKMLDRRIYDVNDDTMSLNNIE